MAIASPDAYDVRVNVTIMISSGLGVMDDRVIYA